MKTLELTRVGQHWMDGGLYKDNDGKFYVDCHHEPTNNEVSTVYILSPSKEPDGEPNYPIECVIKILNPKTEKELEEEKYKFDYMMLSRMQMDCKYYDKNSFGRAHASTPEQYIAEMKRLWNKFPEDLKPEWISWEDILEYEKKLCA